MPVEHSQLLSKKRAVSSFELIVVLVIIGIIAGGIISFFGARIKIAKGKQTVENLSRLAEKVIQFYQANGDWPTEVSDLIPDYLPDGFDLNPFGQAYTIASTGDEVNVWVVVATNVTSGSINTGMKPHLTVTSLGTGWDQVQLFRRITYGGSESSVFDKKYLD